MTPAELDSVTARLEFIGQPQFHRILTCPRTSRRVSFAIAGDISNTTTPVLLCCTPSYCSRYVGGPGVHKLSLKYGVRVVCIDRPGMGGTPRCELQQRVHVSTKNTLSVLEHLGIATVSIYCHSAGIIYALELLRSHPEILHKDPRIYMTSPWVPHDASGQSILPFLPMGLVSTAHITLPRIGKAVNFFGNAFSVSSATLGLQAKKKEPFIFPESFRGPDLAAVYDPQPPYHMDHECLMTSVEREGFQQATSYEPMQGLSQDFMLCMGQGGLFDSAWLASAICESKSSLLKSTAGSVTEGSPRRQAHIEVIWGKDDWMVPLKGRVWLEQQFRAQSPAFSYTSCQLKGLGHDDVIACAEVLGAIFESVKHFG